MVQLIVDTGVPGRKHDSLRHGPRSICSGLGNVDTLNRLKLLDRIDHRVDLFGSDRPVLNEILKFFGDQSSCQGHLSNQCHVISLEQIVYRQVGLLYCLLQSGSLCNLLEKA